MICKSTLNWELLYPVSVGRLEERELELKKEYNSLHQRHTEVRERGRMGKECCQLLITNDNTHDNLLLVLWLDCCRWSIIIWSMLRGSKCNSLMRHQSRARSAESGRNSKNKFMLRLCHLERTVVTEKNWMSSCRQDHYMTKFYMPYIVMQ